MNCCMIIKDVCFRLKLILWICIKMYIKFFKITVNVFTLNAATLNKMSSEGKYQFWIYSLWISGMFESEMQSPF